MTSVAITTEVTTVPRSTLVVIRRQAMSVKGWITLLVFIGTVVLSISSLIKINAVYQSTHKKMTRSQKVGFCLVFIWVILAIGIAIGAKIG